MGEGMNYENDKNSFKKKEQASREIIAEISKKLKVSPLFKLILNSKVKEE